MLASELKEKPISALKEMEKSLEAELFNMKFQLATEQLQDTAKLRASRRDLARVKTVLNERRIAARNQAVENEEA